MQLPFRVDDSQCIVSQALAAWSESLVGFKVVVDSIRALTSFSFRKRSDTLFSPRMNKFLKVSGEDFGP